MMILLWIFILAVAVIIEVLTPALISIWFAVGAALAAAAAWAGWAVWVQIVIFAAVSVLLLFLIARPLKKWLDRNKDVNPTLPDELIGKTGRATCPILPPEFGRVKVGDVEYEASAREPVGAGDLVQVVGRQGIRLMVSPFVSGREPAVDTGTEQGGV